MSKDLIPAIFLAVSMGLVWMGILWALLRKGQKNVERTTPMVAKPIIDDCRDVDRIDSRWRERVRDCRRLL